jgi:hypothetical protein
MKIPPALRRLLIAVRGRTETYVKPAVLPMYGLRGLAPRLIGSLCRLKFASTSIGGRVLRNRRIILHLGRIAPHDGFPVPKALPRSHGLLSNEFGGVLIGLYFTPSVALAAESGVNAAASPNRC